MTTFHERVVAAGAPALPEGRFYECGFNHHGTYYDVEVWISNSAHTEVYASVDRRLATPSVPEIVALAAIVHKRAFPNLGLPADVQALIFGVEAAA